MLKTDFYDDLYGVIAEIKKGRKTYQLPLCEVAVEDGKSSNHKIVNNYRNWFSNCR